HIALLASASSHQTTDAQAKGARELVRDLNRRYGIPANKVVWETPAECAEAPSGQAARNHTGVPWGVAGLS
ncbi:MAG: hypothetical protein M5U12_22085, partial [Verrucomicrobia bacterium]|nr:hypothetical protein [Verrucomicrobiota bacterium]